MGVRPFFIHFHPLFLSHLFSYPKSALNSLLSLMKKHGGILPYRPETGDGEGGSGSDWPAGARRNPIFYFFYFVLFFDLSSPTYF